MRKQLQLQDTGFPSSHQGCIWSLMHILDYHHWHILPGRKHGGGRRIRSSGSRKATLKNRDNGGKKELTAEAEPLLVKQHGKEPSSAKKKSRISQIKASKAKQVTKEESHKRWILSFSGQAWFWSSSEMHDGKPSDDLSEAPYEIFASHEKCTMEQAVSPEEVLESSPSQKLTTSNQLKKDSSFDQFYDHVDLLKLFKANKEFFLKFLQDPNANRNQFPGQHMSNTKVRLTKSSSFPVADPSRARSVGPSTLKHKQNEAFPKGEKLLASSRGPKLVTSESHEDLPEGIRYQGWNQLVMSRFKDLKQKLMRTLQDSKKGNTPISVETHEDPPGCDTKEMSEMLEMTFGEERSKIDGLDDTLGRRRLHRVSRTSSLNESLDRYSQLFESSCRSEAKLHHSRSLKLRSEDKVTLTRNAQKSTRRNLSLPDLDSLCSFLNGPTRDALLLGIPVKNVVDHKTNKENDSHIGPKSVSLNVDAGKSGRLEAILESEFQNSIEDRSETEDLHEFAVEPEEEEEEESRTHKQRDIGLPRSPEGEKVKSSESCTLESDPSELSISEELCSSAKCEQTEMEQMNMNHHSLQSVDKMDEPELNYVRDVLELSGLMGNEYHGTWYSMDEPLDPSVFKELEVRFQHELVFSGNWDRRLLFDSVNETLVDIHERSYTYFPRALSVSGSKHRPMPKGEHLLKDVWTRILLKDVWTRISSYLSFRPELVQSLDDVVARDLVKGDTWMNLHWETDCVALELEDLIFEELLEEVICS